MKVTTDCCICGNEESRMLCDSCWIEALHSAAEREEETRAFERMTLRPDTPREMADLLGLSFDFSREGSPAIVGASGKRHYYAHGGDGQQLEITGVLRRLLSMRAASSP